MKRELTYLGLGLACGALAVVGWRRVSGSPPTVAATPEGSARVTRAAAPWVAPTPLDAASAAAQIDAWLAGDPRDRDVLGRLLPALPAESFARLAEAVLATKGGEARSQFQQVFDVWVERDPAAAARWAGALPERGPLNGRARRLLREQAGLAWARDDIESALAWAHALPDAAGEWGAAAMIYGQLAERDPRRALELARARGDAAFQIAAGKRIYDGWSRSDPAAALQNLGDLLLENGARFYNLSDDIGKWVKQDPEAAVRWVLARDTDESRGAISLFMGLARSEEPAKLASALLRVAGDNPRVDLIAYVANEWIRKDSAGATDWLGKIKDAELRGRIIQRAAGSSSGDTPWDNLDMVVLLPEGEERSDSLASRISAWARVDADAAMAWLKTHDEPVADAAVQAVLIGQLARENRPAALAQLGNLPAGAEKRRATRALVSAWAETAPAEAAAWLARVAASGTETYNHQDWGAAVRPWFNQDKVGARDWVEAQPDPRVREEAGTAWFLALINSPTGAKERADLVLGVRDEARRQQDLANLLPQWFATDPAAARTWLEASPLTEESKDYYRKQHDKAR